MQSWVQDLKEMFPGLIREGETMSRHTTFRVGGPAEAFAAPDREVLQKLLRYAGGRDIPLTVIGNGSNLLVSDSGISGLVIEIGAPMDCVSIEGERLCAGAGTLLVKAAKEAAAAGLSGMEFAAGIPGTIGGAVVMNAGAYGGEMKDILTEVEVFTPQGERKHLPVEELELSYRHSCIPGEGYIVLEAQFKLEKRPEAEIRALMADLRDRRISKQPLEYPSAGSTFKRSEGYFAGKLIQDAGLRGYRVGDAQVSEKHCGFVINRGNASATDIMRLITDVQDKVFERFQVKLEPEVKLVGF